MTTQRPKPMMDCPICGKHVRRVMKQAPDMPNGIKIGVPAAHMCKDGKRVW